MILFGSHPSRSALFIISFIFLFPYNNLAFPLLQNATDPYSSFTVQCKDDIIWVDVGYNTVDCQQALDDFYVMAVFTMRNRPMEFTAQGYRGHSELPVVAVPAKIHSGLSFALIAALN